jgi:uncharacterized protein YndB with AHSA1/START domain
MLAANTIKIHVSQTYKALPTTVYDAWLNPEIARRFLFATDDGRVIRAEIDPRVGGRFFIVDRRPTGDAFHQGVFLELKRPRRMVFSFSVEEHDHNCDRVEIDIEPLGTGCRLTLAHEMCAEWAQHEEKTRRGWAHVIEGLDRELEQRQQLRAIA